MNSPTGISCSRCGIGGVGSRAGGLTGGASPKHRPVDPYWGMVLDKAKAAYGDPNMHYNTDEPSQDRYLVFGDGTRCPPMVAGLPRLGAPQNLSAQRRRLGVAAGREWPSGTTDLPRRLPPSRRRQYAPVDPSGRQLAPLLGNPPAVAERVPRSQRCPDTEKRPRVTTTSMTRRPESAAISTPPASPITEQQFSDGLTPRRRGTRREALTTDEQQSGRAADAVRKLHVELKSRYSQISDAEGKLSEVLLNAHATTADGQQKLNAIQHKIVEAINNPALSLETPAGEQAFLKFLRGQVAGIGEVLKSGTLTAEDQAKAIAALSRSVCGRPRRHRRSRH